MSKTLVLKPQMSEKAYGLSKVLNTYIFTVPGATNKLSVKKAVEEQFKVKVEAVRVSNIKGKTKRSVYKGGLKSVPGRASDRKRAYVTLQKGNQIPVYAAIDEAEKEAKTADTKATTKTKPKSEPKVDTGELE